MAVARSTFLHVFPSFDPGGMEVRAARVIDLLAGHRHLVVAMDGRSGCRERARAAEIELLPPPPRGGLLATARRMAALVRAQRPDLVLTYNWGAIETVAACRWLSHRAAVHHEEGFGVEEVARPLRRRVWLRRLLLGRGGHAVVVVPSQRLQELAVAVYRVPPARVRWLPNGVDLARFVPGPPRADGADVVVGTVAHMRPEKDVAALVAAFARTRLARTRARLLLIGDGPQRPAVERAIAEAGVGDRVELRGAVADTAPVYGELDVFALSSRTEQMPLSVLEAMASGLPVVAPRVGDVAAMVAEGHEPLLAAAGDLDGLARALDTAVADGELRRRLGRANRARCEQRYEQAACLDRHVQLYEQILGRALRG